MRKISIKREQSQAGLSFAEREKFRPQVKNKLLLLLVLLMMAATGAWAQTPGTKEFNVPSSYEEDESTFTAADMPDDFVAIDDDNVAKTIPAPADQGRVLLIYGFDGEKPKSVVYENGKFDDIGPEAWSKNMVFDGAVNYNIKFYYTTAPAPTGYSITLDEGTGNKDSQNWEITPKSSELSGGEDVTVKYNGSREVKSVTVVKKVEKAVDNTYQTWDGTQKKLVAAKIPAEVTTVTNANSGDWSAGTYVVEGQVTFNGTITLNGDVNLIIKDGAKLTVEQIVGNSHNLRIYGQAQMTGELVVNCSDTDAFSELTTLEVHSAKVTASSSNDSSGGFYEISTFNVYGGLIDAKGKVASGYGICLKAGGSMNIYGGEVKAEGKGDDDAWAYGLMCFYSNNIATVKVYGGKLWAENANKTALNDGIELQKGDGFTGKIETSNDGSYWDELPPGTIPNSDKYVRVGY